MTWNSGPMLVDQLVTVAELLATHTVRCGLPGPAWSTCMRADEHLAPCAALGTDTDGDPIVVCWYPAGTFPTDIRTQP